MKKQFVLVTGANGEIGHGLIPALSHIGNYEITALDVNQLDNSLKPYVNASIKTSVLDKNKCRRLIYNEKIDIVFHLAAILSTKAESNPETAHEVNVDGTINLLDLLNEKSRLKKQRIKFIFPSSIAAYGLPSLKAKLKAQKVNEQEFISPITIYGINKLYCEALGYYYDNYYKMLEQKPKSHHIDFRCLRFPGIISAKTIPSGGTSDFAPEMVHSAAQGKNYQSFVRADTKIPFMVMPDATRALIMLSSTPRQKLSRPVYNVAAFSVSAKKIASLVKKSFPDFKINYKVDEARQKIVDSWPAAIDDKHARNDWQWKPSYNLNSAFKEYLIPEIRSLYRKI